MFVCSVCRWVHYLVPVPRPRVPEGHGSLQRPSGRRARGDAEVEGREGAAQPGEAAKGAGAPEVHQVQRREGTSWERPTQRPSMTAPFN